MNLRLMTPTVLAMSLLGGLATAAPQAPQPPDMVEAFTRSLARQCGAAPESVTASLIDRLDLDGDGKLDIVLDAGRYPCPSRPAVFADDGSLVTVFLQGEDGHPHPAFQRAAFGSHLQRSRSGGTSLWLTLGGRDCGEDDPKARCERQVVWRAKVKRLELSDLAAGGPAAKKP